jgi:hypothetical protein
VIGLGAGHHARTLAFKSAEYTMGINMGKGKRVQPRLRSWLPLDCSAIRRECLSRHVMGSERGRSSQREVVMTSRSSQTTGPQLVAVVYPRYSPPLIAVVLEAEVMFGGAA